MAMGLVDPWVGWPCLVQVVQERDTVGAQLVRRNDEVTLLYEKIKIVEMTMRKGERHYKDRLEDLRLLKLEIRKLRCKNNMLEKRNQTGDDLRWVPYLTLPTLPSRWAGCYTCPALRPYQFGPMRNPDVTIRSQ